RNSPYHPLITLFSRCIGHSLALYSTYRVCSTFINISTTIAVTIVVKSNSSGVVRYVFHYRRLLNRTIPMCRLCELHQFRQDLKNLKTPSITGNSTSSQELFVQDFHAEDVNLFTEQTNPLIEPVVTLHQGDTPCENGVTLMATQNFNSMLTEWSMQVLQASKDHVVLPDTDDEIASILDDNDDDDDYDDDKVSLSSSFSDDLQFVRSSTDCLP
ncbi:hypothetical protein BDF19DRAFT_287020, partial [Syncephalis fuscata]